MRTLSQSDGCLGVENQEATQPGASNVNSQLRGYKHGMSQERGRWEAREGKNERERERAEGLAYARSFFLSVKVMEPP